MKQHFNNTSFSESTVFSDHTASKFDQEETTPVILLLTSYPPRECGIATYSQDLLYALNRQFNDSFELQVCALEYGLMDYTYPDEVRYILQTDIPFEYTQLAKKINQNKRICLVVLQHEFGFFRLKDGSFERFLQDIQKPLISVFHTVLPHPGETVKATIRTIAQSSNALIVMTQHSADLLKNDYAIAPKKVVVIPHGTHLVPHLDKKSLKLKYDLKGKKVLSTFGLLNSGKGIETTLEVLPEISEQFPEVVFLILGKSHPGVVAAEGEIYREALESRVQELNLEKHVIFVNKYLSLDELLDYLQLTDIYLFTSIDPHQTVSGTFSYALSCGCPIISTPIPHAKELLTKDTGILIDFRHPELLKKAIKKLLKNNRLRESFRFHSLQRIASTSWENSAIAHASLFRQYSSTKIDLKYSLPLLNLRHLRGMTTDFGIIQFSKFNHPDIHSGYTLDDNARAMIAECMQYELTRDPSALKAIQTYLDFIDYCQQPNGKFLNYVNEKKEFTHQNKESNLSDASGRAIWALGYVISKEGLLPEVVRMQASGILRKALKRIKQIHSPRAMAFAIQGLYLNNLTNPFPESSFTIQLLADRLLQQFRHESEPNWPWFESYLTYANSILPEALLYAWKETGDQLYKEVARTSFDFLLSIIIKNNQIHVVSNNGWLHKGQCPKDYGEQPIDVAYTILTLHHFYDVYGDECYLNHAKVAFSWFLGNNHLSQIVYNPCTGGCYDGLEQDQVNLNQGAESTISYLLARLTMEKWGQLVVNPVLSSTEIN